MSVSFRKREAVYERRDGIKTGWDDARYDQQKRERFLPRPGMAGCRLKPTGTLQGQHKN